jgi:hypothetical protein
MLNPERVLRLRVEFVDVVGSESPALSGRRGSYVIGNMRYVRGGRA